MENFRSKLRIVNAVVSITIAESLLLAEWKKLHNKFGEKSEAGNELAHHQVLIDPSKQPGRRVKLNPPQSLNA